MGLAGKVSLNIIKLFVQCMLFFSQCSVFFPTAITSGRTTFFFFLCLVCELLTAINKTVPLSTSGNMSQPTWTLLFVIKIRRFLGMCIWGWGRYWAVDIEFQVHKHSLNLLSFLIKGLNISKVLVDTQLKVFYKIYVFY